MLAKRFNDNWYFAKCAIGAEPDKTAFMPVEVPHDFLIADTANLYENAVGWYRKTFSNPGGETVYLRFEGVYMDCAVYLNGAHIMDWKYGYTTFDVDVSGRLQDENELRVRVVHQAPNSRWYSGAGIYRDVWLIVKPQTHIPPDGVYISTRQEGTDWTVEIDTEITGEQSAAHEIKHSIIDIETGVVIAQGTERVITVPSPKLWDVISPKLYRVETELLENGVCVDKAVNPLGFRTVKYTPGDGLLLNGRKLRINGVCEHHDLGALGAAMNEAALRRKLETLRTMGVNAIRTAHNPPAPAMMRLADEMGFLICSEAFDMWERPKTVYDYARFFKEWAARDVASWVRRDRNHPSLILWSIGNEIGDTHITTDGQRITKMLTECVRQHDPRQNGRVTIGSNYMAWENAQQCADIIRLAGYNYSERLYQAHHEAHPDWVIYGSETGSVVQSRGIYHFPYTQSLLADDDEQCSSLGNSATSWGAASAEACIIADRDTPFSAGQFIWTGTDYIGEPTPYHTKNSYFGQIDTAGFRKDSFYIYQAEWTDYREAPMVHIFPYWDFVDGQPVDVRVCSNAPCVELFLDGESLGMFRKNKEQLVGHWVVPYQKGILRAKAYDERGNTIAMDEQQSFTEAAAIRVTASKTMVNADGIDLAFIEITMADAQGHPVRNAVNRVFVTVTGAGRLIGLDNGDSTDTDSYKGTSKRLFSGALAAIIAPMHMAGEIQIEVSSEGLPTKRITLTATAADVPEGACTTFARNTESAPNDEIPVRAIKLAAEALSKTGGTRLKAEILPHNATDKNVYWRITNRAGIDANFAVIVADGYEAVVTPLGDGEAWVRCMSKSGTDKTRVIAQYPIQITGMGEAFLNPYGFIAGGLYTDSNVALTNGNERGVATLRGCESHVGFRNVDFGTIGADTITLPLFPLEGGDFPIAIWLGLPNEPDSRLLDTVTYTRGTKWNTYQEESFTLSERIKGVVTVCFVFDRKVHVKGFSFRAAARAFETLKATECDALYGDNFTVTGEAVEDIGNNVSLLYRGMDFRKRPAKAITICGHTPYDANTIQIRFTSETENVTQAIEFTGSNGYLERTFPLAPVAFLADVTFLFLPGSRFDFKWFRFV